MSNDMSNYSRSSIKVDDPYRFLALTILQETFRTIECYYTGEGSDEERADGKESIRWIMKMEGNFKIIAGAAGRPIQEVHQWCIERVHQIKDNARQRLERENK